jgi:hypothetical protein
MFSFDKAFELIKKQRAAEKPVYEIEGIPINSNWVKKMDRFYNLPLTLDEQYIINSSTVVESDIQDLQFRLKRKLRYSELQILQLTSDNGIMIMDNDFQP